MTTRWRRIALIARASPGYIEGVVRGVGLHARPTLPWLFDLIAPVPVVVRKLCSEGIDGAIAVSITPAVAEILDTFRVPAVNAGPRAYAPSSPHVGNDDRAIGQLAARHFLDRGFKHLAFVGVIARGTDYSTHRGEGFRTEAVEQGIHVLEHTPHGSTADLARWLQQIPQPVGVMAASDVVAWNVAEACRSVGLRVPEQVALVGVDDDQLLCHLAYPSLSSIRVAAEQIGRKAAALLAEMMELGELASPQVEIPPVGIAVRQSSNVFAVDDPVLAEALRMIQRRATTHLSVTEIASHAAVSRRVLEQRFRQRLGRSPREEIERVRLELARELLIDTDLSLEEVARRSGFSSGKRLSMVFRRVVNVTPSSLRRPHAGLPAVPQE